MSSVDSPAPDLHGGDHLNTIIIALCVRSGFAICPATTHICTSLAERPAEGRVCVLNVYLGAQAGHVHAQQHTVTHGSQDIPPNSEEPVLALIEGDSVRILIRIEGDSVRILIRIQRIPVGYQNRIQTGIQIGSEPGWRVQARAVRNGIRARSVTHRRARSPGQSVPTNRTLRLVASPRSPVGGCKHALPHSGVKFAILDGDLLFWYKIRILFGFQF